MSDVELLFIVVNFQGMCLRVFILRFYERILKGTCISTETRCSVIELVMRKPDFCICENKDADQLRGNPEADQRLCFRYTDSTIPLLPKSEISSF